MQLKIKYTAILFFALSLSLYSQDAAGSNEPGNPVEVDFLLNYYEQDGNHSPVTGGKGTEELTDVASQVIVHIPMKNNNQLTANVGFDAYSSASSDNIDPVVSGASGSDVRAHLNLDYTINDQNGPTSYGFILGGSTEYDYRSISAGGHWTRTSENGNREFGVRGQLFYDFITLIYPVELRRKPELTKSRDNRLTYNVSATYSQVLTKRAQASLNLEMVYQAGYLATPFHRVYFPGEYLPRIEKLPDSRFKLPVGLRFNYYLSEYLVSRMYYRFYYDDFGITANTFSIEVPVRVSRAFAVQPFYRYHNQSQADYFAPVKRHDPNEDFYTSDYDLSGFNSHKYGLGFRFYPLWPIAQFKIPFFRSNWDLKRFDIRLSRYNRSDGLDVFNVSFGVSFSLK